MATLNPGDTTATKTPSLQSAFIAEGNVLALFHIAIQFICLSESTESTPIHVQAFVGCAGLRLFILFKMPIACRWDEIFPHDMMLLPSRSSYEELRFDLRSHYVCNRISVELFRAVG